MKTITLGDIEGAVAGIDADISMSREFAEVAQEIVQEIASDDSISAIEQAARLAGASFLLDIAKGRVNPKAAREFLKSLFEKKTPAPVQRIEQKTQADFRIIFADALQANPDVLEASLDRALVAQNKIQERLGLPPSLQIPAEMAIQTEDREVEKFSEFQSGQDAEQLIKWQPGMEPEELRKVRNVQKEKADNEL